MNIILSAINTRHTHASLSLALIKAYWSRFPDRPEIGIKEYNLNDLPEEIANQLILSEPDVIAFSTYIWSLNHIINIAGIVKSACPSVKLILGGPEVSFTAKKLLEENSFIDVIISGEGEHVFQEVLLNYISGESLKSTCGISFRSNNNIITNPPAILIEDLDQIPSPFTSGIYGNGRGFTYYEASRGCPSRCSYCLSSVLGRLRYYSIPRIKQDLDWFFTSDYKQVRFADRTFNHNESRAIEIIQYIKDNNKTGINFHFEIHADFLSDKIIDLLSDVPQDTIHLEIGVQSTNKEVLKAVNRPFNLDKLKSQIQKLKEKTNCHIHLDLLGGLPLDTFTKFKTSLDEVYSWRPHDIQISLVKVLRGTPFQRHVELNEVSCSPLPPYTITKTSWLDANEAILINDIGRLVEGINNPGKFCLTIQYITKYLFADSVASFFESLSLYWRATRLTFYNFSPEQVQINISAFLDKLAGKRGVKSESVNIAQTLLIHEYILTQKHPKVNLDYFLGNFPTVKKQTLKVHPSIKIFWLHHCINKINNQCDKIIKGQFPTPYIYEKNASKGINTLHLSKLTLDQCFIIACFIKKIKVEEIPKVWKALFSTNMENIDSAIEKLTNYGVLYEPGQNSMNTAGIDIKKHLKFMI